MNKNIDFEIDIKFLGVGDQSLKQIRMYNLIIYFRQLLKL